MNEYFCDRRTNFVVCLAQVLELLKTNRDMTFNEVSFFLFQKKKTMTEHFLLPLHWNMISVCKVE